MLATRMFFWWNTAPADPLVPAVTIEAVRRVFTIAAGDRGFELPARDRVFVVNAETPGS